MSLLDPKERLLNLLENLDKDTTLKILDFTEYIITKQDTSSLKFDDNSKVINIEPLPMTVQWPKDLKITREDAYSENRGL